MTTFDVQETENERVRKSRLKNIVGKRENAGSQQCFLLWE